MSRELERKVSGADLAKQQSDRILYAEPVELQPGHYVIDTAVTDEQTGRTSSKRVSVFVAPGKNLSLSSLGLVRRFEPLHGPSAIRKAHLNWITAVSLRRLPIQSHQETRLVFISLSTRQSRLMATRQR